MRDVELQKLVDQHAIYGMTHQEIKQHLYEQHGVDKKTHIPPISKRGIEARNFFFQNRRLPDWYDDKFGKDFVKAEELTADDIDEIISITPDDFSGERGTLSFNEISERKFRSFNTDNQRHCQPGNRLRYISTLRGQNKISLFHRTAAGTG